MSFVEPKVTDEIVLSTLREVVSERPEYTYSAPEYMAADKEGGRCFYVHKDEDGTPVSPGCVIGVMLHRLGVPLEWMEQLEARPASSLVGRLFPHLSDRTVYALNMVQSNQDNGNAWGLAYAKGTGGTI
ncbi:hypothetical protein [Streptomyces antarcticus]|uniref:hypothetical protein n=1 Tax=Streptomyces antarcticus TaxID=2996458 RepID=UPI002271A321|nr:MULTISPECIES: hypothetical protein [unclassified Streptomyces]MCY0941890.1 hypothetical protein [Streptomyces sp. H34-AA3]MCZ4082837.1 hypothetical protein [Streptomyces sp. H34-S5]